MATSKTFEELGNGDVFRKNDNACAPTYVKVNDGHYKEDFPGARKKKAAPSMRVIVRHNGYT